MSFTIKKPTMKLPIYWIYILFLLPPFLLNRSDLSIICDLWHLAQLVIVCVMSLYYFVNYRARNTIVNAVLCYYIVAIISSYLNGYSINTIKWDIASDLGIVLVIYLLFNKNKEKALYYLSKILWLYLLINTLVMLIWPNGIASGRIGQIVWFLGGKNNIVPWILIGGGCIILDSHERNKKMTFITYLKLAICSVQAFLCDSSTAVVVMIILWGIYLINIIVNNQKLLNFFMGGKRLFLLVAIGFVFVVFFTTRSNVLQEFSEWFGKDITFNGRTGIWIVALNYIKDNPWFGAGPVLVFDMGWSVYMTHAHCLYLNICAHNGIIGLSCLIYILWNVLKNAKKIPLVAIFSLFLYLIGSIVEVYSLNTLLLFSMVLNCLEQKNSRT